MPDTAHSNERLGYAYMVGSSLLFAVMGVFVKLASAHLPFYEVSFYRAFGGFLLTAIAVLALRLPVQPREPVLLIARGVLGWAALVTYFMAIAGLHLADAVLLNYTSPFFTTLLAAVILRERLTSRTILCLLGATAGVAFVVGPQGGFWNWSALAALGSAFCAALAYVAVKKANASNPPWVIVGVFSLVASLLCLPLMAFGYRAPSPMDWLLLAGAAATGTAAQIMMTYGYRHARASTASVITLMTPLLAAVLSIAFLGAGLTWGTVVGGSLILAAGTALYLGARPVEAQAPAEAASAR